LREIAVSRGVDTCAGHRAAKGLVSYRTIQPQKKEPQPGPTPETRSERPARHRAGWVILLRPAASAHGVMHSTSRGGNTHAQNQHRNRGRRVSRCSRATRSKGHDGAKWQSKDLQQQYNGAVDVREPALRRETVRSGSGRSHHVLSNWRARSATLRAARARRSLRPVSRFRRARRTHGHRPSLTNFAPRRVRCGLDPYGIHLRLESPSRRRLRDGREAGHRFAGDKVVTVTA